jgi:hypothetical protein
MPEVQAFFTTSISTKKHTTIKQIEFYSCEYDLNFSKIG